jgi:alkane 1-monooxygenase
MTLARPGYLLAFGFPVIAALGYLLQEPWLFFGITVAWLVLLQVADELAGHERAVPWKVLSADITPPTARFPVENVLMYAYVLLHLVVVALGVWQFDRSDDVLAWMVYAVPVALSGATVLVVAHELLHGSTRLDRWIGRAAATPAFWSVHEFEHLFLHHKDESFCTEADVAAARLGQSFYSYLVKSIVANYRHAWSLQASVLRARGKSFVGARILATIYLPAVLLAALVAILFGFWALVFFVLQAFLTVFTFLLGTYNQHYGLLRRTGPDGRPEAFNYMNIWSADQRVTRLAFWSIGHHAHHHLDPFRSYPDLRVVEGSPLLPHGYFTTLMLALVPPLWFRTMNPRVEEVFARRDRLHAQGFI